MFHVDMTLMVVLGIEKQCICLSVFLDDVCVYVCVCDCMCLHVCLLVCLFFWGVGGMSNCIYLYIYIYE